MGDVFSGDSKSPSSTGQAKAISSALATYLPDYASKLSAANKTVETNLLNLKKQLMPEEQDLYTNLYAKYAPEYAKTAQELEDISSAGELSRLQGSGGQAYQLAEQMARQSDPEYYKTRELVANKLAELVNSPLSRNESESIARGLNRTNTNEAPSNLSTISNAMNFGSAARDRLGQALNFAIKATPSFRTTDAGNIFNTASGRGRNTNQQQQSFGTSIGTTGLDLGQNYTNNLFGLKNTEMSNNANRRSVVDYMNQSIGAFRGGQGII